MRQVALALMVLLVSGCAMFKALPFTEETKKYQSAQTYFEQGNFKVAYDAYQAIAGSRSPWAEESKFNAAYVLVYYKNPQKDYATAEKQFEEFLVGFPKSKFINEAHTWLDMLKMFHQTKAGELSKEIVTLTIRVENTTKDLRKVQAETEALKREREALLSERATLAKWVDDLLNEKEALIKKNTELSKDNEGLIKDKAVLSKKIDALNKEKKSLVEAKASLEKILHDLTMVDVKMEKQRKKIKKEENK